MQYRLSHWMHNISKSNAQFVYIRFQCTWINHIGNVVNYVAAELIYSWNVVVLIEFSSTFAVYFCLKVFTGFHLPQPQLYCTSTHLCHFCFGSHSPQVIVRWCWTGCYNRNSWFYEGYYWESNFLRCRLCTTNSKYRLNTFVLEELIEHVRYFVDEWKYW